MLGNVVAGGLQTVPLTELFGRPAVDWFA